MFEKFVNYFNCNYGWEIANGYWSIPILSAIDDEMFEILIKSLKADWNHSCKQSYIDFAEILQRIYIHKKYYIIKCKNYVFRSH